MEWLPKENDADSKLCIRAVIDGIYYGETPTVKVYAAILDTTKHISRVVKLLNEILPIPSLQHLKRVKRDEGRTYVILDLIPSVDSNEEAVECPLKKIKLDDNSYLEKLKDKGFNYEELGVVGVNVFDVPKLGPKCRVQYEKSMEYWPVNFHPEKKVETMMSNKIFEDSEMNYHLDNMKYVIRKSIEKKKNVALIVDFVSKQYIGLGFDRVEHHPLQHAIMVAIDAVASTQKGGAWDLPFTELTFTNETVPNQDNIVLESQEEKTGPYLCTGYDLYVLREPCVMCAMSLVHSRIKRVFFHVRNSEKGALVSKCHIHTIKDLNHHYDVFEIVKE